MDDLVECQQHFEKYENITSILTPLAMNSQDEDVGPFESVDALEESTTSLVSSSTSAYSSFPVDVVVYVRVQVLMLPDHFILNPSHFQ